MRVHFSVEDWGRLRYAPRPSPVPELHAALLMLGAPHEALLFGRWRARTARALSAAAGPLADLVPGGSAPVFLDVLGETRQEGFAEMRAAPPELVRSELERVYAGHGGPAPAWVRSLHAGGPEGWRTLAGAQRAAYEAVLAPVWGLVQDLHRAEFARHAVALAEGGPGAALTALAPGSVLQGGVWTWPAGSGSREVRLGGRGLVLLPTFHWRGAPLVQDRPGRPVVIAYPAGPGLPPVPAEAPGGSREPLAGVLGPTRAALLRALPGPRTTTELARALGVSAATVSGHTAALREAGLLTTVRTGRSVHHARAAVAELLLR
ncbi:ArsR/SmtB family transcription factor [Streptomyces sp. NPDC007945]|uniref:ArsR/SmtB family transcription factor n=1 Tax=Streptomyces sp. NPDC007945 TaxID=3364797 RepID=UPI0036E8E043